MYSPGLIQVPYSDTNFCKTANNSVQDIIVNLASEASRYFILPATIQLLGSRAFQQYMACLYSGYIGMSYIIGKLLISPVQ